MQRRVGIIYNGIKRRNVLFQRSRLVFSVTQSFNCIIWTNYCKPPMFFNKWNSARNLRWNAVKISESQRSPDTEITPYVAGENILSSKDEQNTDRPIYNSFFSMNGAENILKFTNFSPDKLSHYSKSFMKHKWKVIYKKRRNNCNFRFLIYFMTLIISELKEVGTRWLHFPKSGPHLSSAYFFQFFLILATTVLQKNIKNNLQIISHYYFISL